MYYADLKKVNKLLTYAIMLFKKKGGGGRDIVSVSHKIRRTPSSLYTVRGNADRITASAKLGTKVVV